MIKGKALRKALALLLALALLTTGIGLPQAHAEGGKKQDNPATGTPEKTEQPNKEEKEKSKEENTNKVTIKGDGFELTLEVNGDKVDATVKYDKEHQGVEKVEILDKENKEEGKTYPTLNYDKDSKSFTGKLSFEDAKKLIPNKEEKQTIYVREDAATAKASSVDVTSENAKKLNDAIKEVEDKAEADKAAAKRITDDITNDKAKLKKEDYTTKSWEAFEKFKIEDGAEANLEKANKAKEAYDKAKEGLVKVDGLNEAIKKFEKAKDQKDKYYTEASLKAYNKKLEDAKKLLRDGTKEQVAAAIKDLEKADLILIDPNMVDFISRIAGKDRIATAIEISKKYFDKDEKKVDAVILAGYDKFADALSAASLANLYNGPVLLTHSDKLDEEVYKEIERLNPGRVFLVGGEKALSKKVKEDLGKLTLFGIDRIAGKDRYDTAAAVARKFVEKTEKEATTAIIASGEDWPDALTASTLAIKTKSPVLLVRSNSVGASVEKAIKDLGVKNSYIIGGKKAVSEELQKELPKLIKRLKGSNRYETAAEVAKQTFPKSDHAFLVSGEAFADALAIGPVAGRIGSPILLTQKEVLPKASEKVLKNDVVDNFTIIGGVSVVKPFKLENEENDRDANIKAGKAIEQRFKEIPKLKDALDRK